MNFEESIDRLEEIVQELDGDDVELARALELFEEGVERLRSASSELARAESQLKLLVESADGTLAAEPRD
jgi:exodeoxyribonuclease VII small subunit